MAPQDQDEKDFDERSMTASISHEDDYSHDHDKAYISSPPPPPPPMISASPSPSPLPSRDHYDLTHMDSAAEYSIGSSEASLQMAQYLDNVESSGGVGGHVVDICSFQDVNLDEDDHHHHGHDGGDEEGMGHNSNEVRRARKRYYLLPMLIRYSLPIGGCLIAFLMVIVTVAVTASVVRRQDRQALGAVVNSPVYPGDQVATGYETVGGWDDDVALKEAGMGEESVGDDALSFSTYDDAPRYDDVATADDFANKDDLLAGEEDVGEPLSFSTNDDQPQMDREDATTADATTSSNTSNGSSNTSHPKWYSTSHPTYVNLLEFHSSTSTTMSPHHTAALFCNELKQQLCSYSTYCPSGKSADPFDDGPFGLFDQAQREWEQWSPVNTHGQGVEWVQVGKVVDAEDEYWGRCWRYDEWSGGKDLETTVGAEHRRYILCCDGVNI
ncbi:hypothetical protein HJC23_013594 [Cyclotella cryptica]|uniref:DUF7495 domain-containing protein n=1 Tax=Cyclotella cryptica TaxID=29204 RepID=A0ABD3PR71_9STRA|eukprot:CCRYP_012315-RA/>CCRYP_012315-RA protein AED:0.03 eAED:0.03 QI:476/1/1/1/0/0/2/604/440